MPENAPTHYRITVNAIIMAHNELFRPGDRYTVTAAVYNSEVNGKPFKEFCATAQPMTKKRVAS